MEINQVKGKAIWYTTNLNLAKIFEWSYVTWTRFSPLKRYTDTDY